LGGGGGGRGPRVGGAPPRATIALRELVL
jgi:hypothetical protein